MDARTGYTDRMTERGAQAQGGAHVRAVAYVRVSSEEQRRHGYATAVTAACTGDALAREAQRVVLFTDLADPSANAMYQRIGFRPIGGRRVVQFRPTSTAAG